MSNWAKLQMTDVFESAKSFLDILDFKMTQSVKLTKWQMYNLKMSKLKGALRWISLSSFQFLIKLNQLGYLPFTIYNHKKLEIFIYQKKKMKMKKHKLISLRNFIKKKIRKRKTKRN